MKFFGSRVVHEQPVDPHVLRADDRTQIGPFRVGRVRRRVGRARADMAEPAGHADPIGTDQILVVVIGRIVEIALGGPSAAPRPRRNRGSGTAAARRCRSDSRNRSRPAPSCPRAPILTPGYFVSLANGSAGQSRRRVSSIRPKRSGSGCARRLEARLVDQPEIAPAPVAVGLLCRIVRDDLQQVEGAEGAGGHPVPEAVVAAGPEQPRVAALDLVRGQRDAAVHIVEIILPGGREGRGVAPGGARFVENLAGPWTTVEAGEEQHAEQSGCPARQRPRP